MYAHFTVQETSEKSYKTDLSHATSTFGVVGLEPRLASYLSLQKTLRLVAGEPSTVTWLLRGSQAINILGES